MSVKVKMLKTLNAKECLDDIKTLKNKKQLASLWFKELRGKICKSFEEIENNKSIKKQITFNQKSWDRDGGGGGVISIMHGDIFEKVGVRSPPPPNHIFFLSPLPVTNILVFICAAGT